MEHFVFRFGMIYTHTDVQGHLLELDTAKQPNDVRMRNKGSHIQCYLQVKIAVGIDNGSIRSAGQQLLGNFSMFLDGCQVPMQWRSLEMDARGKSR